MLLARVIHQSGLLMWGSKKSSGQQGIGGMTVIWYEWFLEKVSNVTFRPELEQASFLSSVASIQRASFPRSPVDTGSWSFPAESCAFIPKEGWGFWTHRGQPQTCVFFWVVRVTPPGSPRSLVLTSSLDLAFPNVQEGSSSCSHVFRLC